MIKIFDSEKIIKLTNGEWEVIVPETDRGFQGPMVLGDFAIAPRDGALFLTKNAGVSWNQIIDDAAWSRQGISDNFLYVYRIPQSEIAALRPGR